MIACLWVACFGAALARQALPNLPADTPLIMAQYAGRRGLALALDERAAQAGVYAGMPLRRAKALCPEAEVTLMQPSLIRGAQDRMLARYQRFSQYLALERRSVQQLMLLVDLGALRPEDGLQIGHEMLNEAAQEGLRAVVGLAANPFTARVAALTAPETGIRLVHRLQTAAFLAEQPTALLPASKEVARRLDLFCLQRMGQVAALPRGALMVQFGAEGRLLHRLACGQDSRRIARYTPPQTADAGRAFEPPLEDASIVQSVLNALAVELMTPLASSLQACAEVILTLRLDNGVEIEQIARPRQPLEQPIELARLLGRLFEKQTPPAAVQQVMVQIGRLSPVKPRQLPLFAEEAVTPPHAFLRDLSARYGKSYFYTIAPVEPESPLPEQRFVLEAVDAA